MHPAYLAKSYFPNALLAAVGLRSVGSRAVTVVPRSPSKGTIEGARAATTQLFVAGSRNRFRDFTQALAGWNESSEGAPDLIKIEDFRALNAEDRIRPFRSDEQSPLMEIALHGAGLPLATVLDGFRAFLATLGVDVEVGRHLVTGPLLFLPLRIPRVLVSEIAQFAFLRVAREMPALRLLEPRFRLSTTDHAPRACRLPVEGPLDPTIEAAIFDGGLPSSAGLEAWVKQLDAPGVGPAVPAYQEHGLAVTSALLFGPLDEDREAPVPYGRGDHHRVLDESTMNDPQGELYPVLERVVAALKRRPYEFFSLSIGPDQPVEDDEVSAWTALLDPLLARGDALAMIAAGNSGSMDAEAGQNRIQPPSDCVNALAIGACGRQAFSYDRASYSSIGPGRSPGRIKPDLVTFAGTPDDPFWALGGGAPGRAVAVSGTSFGAPAALRIGLGVRAHLGPDLRPLTIRALLVHRSEENRQDRTSLVDHDRDQLGWGRVLGRLEDLLTCPDDTVYVVYQGILLPRQFLRAQIPTPSGEIPGRVHIAATICIGSETDPEHPSNYTRSGLEVVFRPHMEKRREYLDKKSGKKRPSPLPPSSPFFLAKPYMSEGELREDAHKWETTLCAYRSFKGASLSDPAFELHHTPRLGGSDVYGSGPIPYAMIVTVQADQVKDLYNRVYIRYKSRLVTLVPVLDLPISA